MKSLYGYLTNTSVDLLLCVKTCNAFFCGLSCVNCKLTRLPHLKLLRAMAEAARLLNAIFTDYDCKALRLYLKKNYGCNARQAEEPHGSLLHHVALLRCTDCDKASMVQTLVRRGVEVDSKDDNGMTPLMNCADLPAAKALLKAGAELHAVCSRQKTALHWAAGSCNPALVTLLLQSGASATAVCSVGCLPLHCAIIEESGDDITVSWSCL
jgi:Ankyrin repeats (3 copies)